MTAKKKKKQEERGDKMRKKRGSGQGMFLLKIVEDKRLPV